MKHHPPAGTTPRARRLRNSPTNAERAIWRVLRESLPNAHFRRQVPIRHYIADFASHRGKLVIEVDGGQHNPSVDTNRTKAIADEGYRVLRFWNNEALGNPEGIHGRIASALREQHPHLASPIKGEES